MNQTFMQFLQMGGYGFYVWGSYGCVFALLMWQWFRTWRQWRVYLRDEQT